jgi:hypothetical protein
MWLILVDAMLFDFMGLFGDRPLNSLGMGAGKFMASLERPVSPNTISTRKP